ncbi:MAG: sodium:solute symporter family protein [Bryobacterales bacterium]
MPDVMWPAAVAMVVNYLLVLVVGIAAGRAAPRDAEGEAQVEDMMLAGRALPLWVGILTTTATWVGGGYINGTAEASFSRGVLWGVQAGVGYALSLVVGGLFFARVMRGNGYWTLVDPLEQRYGRAMAAVLLVPAVAAEVVWSAAILLALGSTFGTVAGITDLRVAVIGSAAVAVLYTAFGGLRAVAWTDVLQLGLLLVGLGIVVPFALADNGVGPLLTAAGGHGFGSVHEGISWLDYTVLLIFGGIPWNCYFQRVLSAPSADSAVRMSLWAGAMCLVAVIPPLVIGLAAATHPWTEAQAAQIASAPALVLPYYLRFATPTWIAVFGLGAVTAAVMSSVDSSILSASSLLSWNLYRRLIRPAAGPKELEWLVRGLVLSLGTVATVLALTVGSVASLWYLCGDIVYVALFPQLTLAMFDPKANRAGAIAGLLVGGFLRLGGGEPAIGLARLLLIPRLLGQAGSFRTLAMLGEARGGVPRGAPDERGGPAAGAGADGQLISRVEWRRGGVRAAERHDRSPCACISGDSQKRHIPRGRRHFTVRKTHRVCGASNWASTLGRPARRLPSHTHTHTHTHSCRAGRRDRASSYATAARTGQQDCAERITRRSSSSRSPAPTPIGPRSTCRASIGTSTSRSRLASPSGWASTVGRSSGCASRCGRPTSRSTSPRKRATARHALRREPPPAGPRCRRRRSRRAAGHPADDVRLVWPDNDTPVVWSKADLATNAPYGVLDPDGSIAQSVQSELPGAVVRLLPPVSDGIRRALPATEGRTRDNPPDDWDRTIDAVGAP